MAPPGPPGLPILKFLTPGISGSSARHSSCIWTSVSSRVSPFVNSTNTVPPRVPLSKAIACLTAFEPVSAFTFSSILYIASNIAFIAMSLCAIDEPGSSSTLACIKSEGILGKNCQRTKPLLNKPMVTISMPIKAAKVVYLLRTAFAKNGTYLSLIKVLIPMLKISLNRWKALAFFGS